MFPILRNARRQSDRGFSLIELGIVIAVIAVLASVVIFGRGFITAGRVSKAVEGLNTIRKAGAAYAGLQGGSVTTSTTNEIGRLGGRSLLPVTNTATTWDIAGEGTNRFQVQDIRFQVNGNQNAVAVRLDAPATEQAQDVYTSVAKDQNYVKTAAAIGGLTCQGLTQPTTKTVVLCFNL